MMKETEWKEFTEGSLRFRIRAKYGIDYDFGRRNNQSPHFSVTGEIDEIRGGRWKDSAGGMLHEDVARHFPFLKKYLQWHLVDLNEPLHYIANAKYWWEMATGTGKWEKRTSDPEPIEAFKGAIVFGGIAGEKLPPVSTPWSEVKAWLEERKPYLMDNFEADMKELGVFQDR